MKPCTHSSVWYMVTCLPRQSRSFSVLGWNCTCTFSYLLNWFTIISWPYLWCIKVMFYDVAALEVSAHYGSYPIFAPLLYKFKLWVITEVEIVLLKQTNPKSAVIDINNSHFIWIQNNLHENVLSNVSFLSVFLQDLRPWCRYFPLSCEVLSLSCPAHRGEEEKDGWHQDDLNEIDVFSLSFVIKIVLKMDIGNTLCLLVFLPCWRMYYLHVHCRLRHWNTFCL